jgi:phosphoglycerate dehydrogenase-like enzyme
MSERLKVLVTPEAMRDRPGAHVDVLREAGFEVGYPKNPHFARGLGGEDETITELADCVAVIASGEPYTQRVFQQLPSLRVVARCGVGYDAVDVAAATRHNVPLTITPTSNHEAVAEVALSLIFAVAKRTVVNHAQVRNGNWPRILSRPIRGTTLGLVGLGRIGRSTAVRAIALGMNVLACESCPDMSFVDQQAIRLVDLDTLVSQSDYVSLHCPLNEQTRGMFNRYLFARMKTTAVLINTARGKLVVEADLIQALRDGQIAGAGLDVYEVEPPASDNPLLTMDNVVLSPHIAGTDELSFAAMGLEAAECIIKLRAGQWPHGAVVNDQLQSTWSW